MVSHHSAHFVAASLTSGLRGGRGLRRWCLEEPDQLTDGVVAVLRMAKRELAVELVPIAAPVTRLREVTGLLEVGNDLRRASLGDSNRGGDVPEPHGWVGSDTRQDVSVIRDEAPRMISFTRIYLHESLLLYPRPQSEAFRLTFDLGVRRP